MNQNKQKLFWHLLGQVDQFPDATMDDVHWFEAMCLSYSMDPVPVDQLASCLAFYDLKEE